MDIAALIFSFFDFAQYVLFITATTEHPALQRYGVIERNAVGTDIETVSYLRLEVCTVSDRCHYVSFESYIP